MTKNFRFLPLHQKIKNNISPPLPAKNFLPDWLKNMPRDLELPNRNPIPTAKKCMPFVDSFISGYIQTLPCDVKLSYVGKRPGTNEDIINYEWAGPYKPLSSREETENRPLLFPKFDGYYHAELQWDTFWEPETPFGYSTLYTHPSNRFDLPFHTMSGIIDTDSWSVTGPIPFLLKKGFEGVIAKGTPIYQMHFIKRESWLSIPSDYDPKVEKLQYEARSFFTGGYKKLFWKRKNFN
jgi:hypothetical protein